MFPINFEKTFAKKPTYNSNYKRKRLNKFQQFQISYQLYFKKGLFFISGKAGSGKTHLMLAITKYSIGKKFACYTFRNENEYQQLIDKEHLHGFSIDELRENKNLFYQIKATIQEELKQGYDIIFDEAEMFFTEESIPILKSLFDTEAKNRIFLVCQTTREEQICHRLPLRLLKGLEIAL